MTRRRVAEVHLCRSALRRATGPSCAALCACLCAGAIAQTEEAPVFHIEPMIITASRLPSRSPDQPFTVTEIEADEIRRAPQLRLDDVLRNAAPGFSLFRRSSSRVAHPTAQGVSLRNVGPNGAGRSLVLADGIPLNDPFAGWIPWARVPPSSVDTVIVNPGGGAGLFGNAALAGTIHLTTANPAGTGGQITGTFGNRETYDAAINARMDRGDVVFSTYANRFSTGGYPVLQADQRGRVDTDADASSWLWHGRGDWTPDEHSRFTVLATAFEEERGNGTLLTRNSTTGQDFSAAFTRFLPTLDAELRLQGYLQRRKFRSTFSSVNATRSEETLALDQYDVPANAAGASAVWSQRIAATHRLIAGVDFRWVEGETNEAFLRIDDAFTRTRHAGGRQLFAGAFLEETWQASDAVQVVAGGRVDYWRQYDGTRLERSSVSGLTLRSEEFAAEDGLAPNGRLGISAQMSRETRARAAAYTGFRVPTLNELYRPFRVGNDITEANAALEPEQLFGGELGVDWEPTKRFTAGLTGFYNELHDAIGNVTIGEGPGTFKPGGFLPAGGVLRQRRNLDRVEVLGVEAKLLWQFADAWRLRAQYVQTHAVVGSAAEARQLEGKRLAQAPEQVAVAALDWSQGAWHGTAQLRYVGEQFEDDLNTLELAPFTTVDLSLGYRFSERASAIVRVENLFDTEAETGKTASGLISIGPPRLVSLTVGLTF
jgi:outer membrane receptor protein involved in Fe transport